MIWQTVESAPKDGTILLLSDGVNVGVGRYVEDKGQILIAADKPYWDDFDHSHWDIFDITENYWFEPTHWMVFPEPPRIS